MIKIQIYLVLLIYSFSAQALVPVEGLILGDVQDIKQYDPLAGLLSYNYVQESTSSSKNLNQRYLGLYQQGASLKFQCDKDQKLLYRNEWSKKNAARTVTANLQYVGLDITIKAIAAYAKELELGDDDFKILADNLVNNTCSQNLTVYSLKLLRKNLSFYWENENDFNIPSFKGNKRFSKVIKDKHDRQVVLKREMNFTLKNFRAFCSWGGDTDNYGLLTSYVKNPFIMSFIHNKMLNRRISLDAVTEKLIYSKKVTGVKVACENLICRNRSTSEFLSLFPRLIGSTNLEKDLDVLYCDYFQKQRVEVEDLSPTVAKWVKKQSEVEPLFETSNFVSLVTGIPDLFLSLDRYEELLDINSRVILNSWDKWASSKVSNNVFNLLAEESLEIKLRKKVRKIESYDNRFDMTFDITLGEFDRSVNNVDKIKASFNLEFPKKYLSFLHRQNRFYKKRGDWKNILKVERKLVQNIHAQLSKKKKYFTHKIWDENMALIVGNEILDQLDLNETKSLHYIDSDIIKVPIKLKFGLFALQYLRKKYQFKQSEKELLTFK